MYLSERNINPKGAEPRTAVKNLVFCLIFYYLIAVCVCEFVSTHIHAGDLGQIMLNEVLGKN